MSVPFDPPISRSNFTGIRLDSDNTEIKIGVVIERADGSGFQDIFSFLPSELPAAAKDFFEAGCKAKAIAKYVES